MSKTPFHGLGARSAMVAQELRTDILNGVFPPGSKLPTEHQLCSRFGITRPTVRKGIACLAAEGLVVVRAGAGMFVSMAPRETVKPSVSRTLSVMYHFAGSSLTTIQRVASEAGFLLCTYSQMEGHWWDPANERQFLEGVKAERLRGLIAFCSPREPRNEDVLAELEALGVRVVHIEPYAPELPAQSYIIPDYETAGAMAATELMLATCGSYAFLPMGAAPFEILSARGFARTLSAHGPGFNPEQDCFTLSGFSDTASPKATALADFLKSRQRPIGIFCRAPHNADSVRAVLIANGLDPDRDARLVAIDQDGGRKPSNTDLLVFDHLELIKRAVSAIAEPAWRGVRELVKPDLRRVSQSASA